MKFTNIFLALGLVLTLSSCEDFLDQKTSKSTSKVVETVVELDFILNRYDSFQSENCNTISYSSDDFGLIPEMFDKNPAVLSVGFVHFAAWDIDNIINAQSDNCWSGEYKKIFTANMILDNLSKVSGSEADKERIRREALFVRAYSMWYLAQIYCLPYNESTKREPGLPLKKSISFQENLGRASLEDTYRFIEGDLNEALKTETTFKSGTKNRIWRESKAAVYGFAARFYLNQNNYTKASEFAEKALGEFNVLVDYNTEMSYAPSPSKVTVDGKLYEINYPKTYDNSIQLELEWKESYYYRALYNPIAFYIPSQELMNAYDNTYDLRYKYHFVEHLSFVKGLSKPSYDYPGYVFFGMYYIPSGPSVSEMMLIKAECLARSGNSADAMDVVNLLRAKRMDRNAPSDVINLSATTPDEALLKIIEERRREFPFTQRWYDIRRLNSNDDTRDDIGDLTRTFYGFNNSGVTPSTGLKSYSLPKNSRRYAQPIHFYEIETSFGAIQQNRY